MRSFLTKKAALLVYKNMILPLLEYGDIFLSSLSQNTKNKLQVLQNKGLRLALLADKRESTKPLHEEATLQKLKVRRKVHTLQFLFRKKADRKLFARIPRRGTVTRSAKKINFKIRKPNTEKYKNCVAYYGRKLWNQLPSSKQGIDEGNCFKFRIKTLLFKIVDKNQG